MTELYFRGIFLVFTNNVIKEHLNCSLNLKIHNKKDIPHGKGCPFCYVTRLSMVYTRISNLPWLFVVAVAISCGLAAASALFAGLAGASALLLAAEALLCDFWEICASICLICCSICFVFVSLVFASSELASILSNSASSFAFCFSSALVSVVLDVEVVYDVEPETADILIIIPPFLTSNIILLQIRNVKTR